MAKTEDLRALKDQAAKDIEKRRYDKAAELYVRIAAQEADPDWLQRAGEAFRRAGNKARAIAALTVAADGYARGGFLLKAIAVNKSILQIDPQHTATQAMLAELYARRDGVAPDRSSVPVPVPVADRPMPAPLRPPSMAPAPIAVVETILETRADAPIGALPLREVLSSRRSEQFAVADIAALVEESAAEPAAYEIVLEADELIEADAVVEVVRPMAPLGRMAAPAQAETDFGGLMDEPPVAPPAPPQVPLFSSLAEAELRLLIERMSLRTLAPGEIVVREGERGGSLFVLVDGEVSVTIGPEARELARLQSGAFFGEMGVLSDDPRSATVAATAPTQLLEISRELTWDIARRSPEVLRTIVRFFRDRMLERLLGTSPLFSQLSPDDARALASQFVFLELEVGVAVVKQGARSPGLYFLLCGEAEAVRDGVPLALLRPGDVFGEISLLLRTPASADVRAKKKCWALELPQARFQEIMLSYPQVLEYVSNLSDARRLSLTRSEEQGRDGRVDLH